MSDWYLIAALVVAFFYFVARHREASRKLDCVFDLLVIWATLWTKPAVETQQALRERIEEYRAGG